MAAYGVGVSNPFDLLTEDGQAPKQAAPKADDKKQQQKPKKPAGDKPLLPQTGGDAPQGKPGAGRGAPARGRGAQRGAAGRRRGGPRVTGTGHDANPMTAGGAHGGNAHGRRPFERHSASGRGREQRKGGAGGYAASGTYKDDIAAEGGVEAIAAAAQEGAAAAAGNEAAVAAAGADAAPDAGAIEEIQELTEEQKKALEEEEAESKKLTFDQFMAQKAAKMAADDAKRDVRKVQIDDKRFKAAESFKRDSIVMFDDTGKPNAGKAGAAEAKKPAEKKAAAAEPKGKKEKKTINIDEFKVKTGGLADAPAERQSESFDAPALPQSGRGGARGGRGGRGGARGGPRGGAGAPRGGPRGGRGGQRGGRGGFSGDMQSEELFPKLGK